jgi:hypothetical protein
MRSSEAALGRGRGRAAPCLRDNELKKTGARSARARMRGQNPLVLNKRQETGAKKSAGCVKLDSVLA